MSRITLPETVSEEAKRIFDEIRGAFGNVPKLFRTYVVHPPRLKANWNKVKAVMMQGSLSATQRGSGF